ncbi:MAG: hypothetical protein K0R03_1040 [Moraxellaceae bacterium]|jgi:uncharacterized protein YqiB (DUF1249 family)|nr:hypothetical protein [Moraxellaceae bacterium]MDF3030482.1 hypothetical protein [Moraxellaceae bacterium]
MKLFGAPLHTAGSTRYTVDLQHLQTVCALNYGRLRRLLPDLAAQEGYRFFWEQPGAHPAELDIEVLERSVYTDTLLLRQTTTRLPWCPRLDMEVRIYHDVELAEVLRFQTARRIAARNRYPNPAMQARDEKTQVNEFLAECLEHCLREGYADWQLPVGLTGAASSAM